MKKRIVLITSIVLLLAVAALLFVGCNKMGGEEQLPVSGGQLPVSQGQLPVAQKKVPVYKGMTISTSKALSSESYDSPLSVNGNGDGNAKVEGDFVGRNDALDEDAPFVGGTIEEELGSSFEAVDTPDMNCYAGEGDDVYAHILFDNPDDFEIVSVTFNGKQYSSDMFEEGSDAECVTLKCDVGAQSGITKYVVEDIKYQDETETKSVIVEGVQTATVGIQKAGQVTATVSDVDIDKSGLSFRVNVIDEDGLIAFSNGSLKVNLYDGTDIVATKDLVLGKSTVTIGGLKANTLYQYAVVGYYDDLSGDGYKMNVLYKDAFYTQSTVLFDNVVVDTESISFGFYWDEDHETKAITSLKLYQGDALVKELSVSQNLIVDLLSNTAYRLVAEYLNGDAVESIEIAFTTLGKAVPEISIIDPTQTKDSVGFFIREVDADHVGAVTKIELLHANGNVVAEDLTQRIFTGLLSGNVYTVRVTYVYNMGDGTGDHTVVRELAITTADQITDEKDIDLKNYSIVSGAELAAFGQQYVLDFAQKLSALTALDISVKQDTVGNSIKNQKYEILIGLTRREESINAYNDIDGEGWMVRIVGRKVVIVGTTPYLTTVALSWFEQTYLNAEHIDGTVLSVQQQSLTSDMPILSLTENGTTFTVVYETGKDENDAPYQIATKVQTDLSSKTGLTVPFVTASNAAVSREILVGNMSRADVKAEMAKIEADEYAVTVKDGKIYLVAWSDDVLPAAYELFCELLNACAVTDAQGNVTYHIPSGCTIVKTYESGWITDFVKPEAEGLYPEAAVDANDNALQYIYAGEGATRETFVAYCQALIAAGFTPLESEDVQWEGSSFRTFVHYEKGVSLHVSHRAFTHAAEQDVEGLLNSIRIVSGPLTEGGNLVDEDHFRPQVEGEDYVKRTDSQITSNVIDATAADNWGLGQIITLADGSFVIIDGGRAKSTKDVTTVWNILNEMHKKAHGAYPTEETPLHIRAWIITHEHGDHHNAVQGFIKTYGARSDLKFDYMLANFGSMTQLRTAAGTYSLRNNLKTYQETVKNGFEFIQVNSGQVFYFANCKLEILVTVDDMYPWRCSEQNNASLIVRTTLYENDGTNSCEVTSLWLGDSEVQQSAVARAMYGSFLESDQVQVAHHGNNGGSDKRIYEMVGNCEVIWYPNQVSQSALDRAGSDSWACNFSAAFLNPNCKLMIFNGSNLSSCPAWNVTLTITATGALYDQLYDAATGEPIEAKGELWPVIDVPAYREAVGK